MFELIVTLGDRQVQKYRGSGNVVSIGRDPGCDVVLDNLGVSRRHAEIRQIEDRYVLADKASTNGVYIGDRRVTSTELGDGDTFRIAKFSLRFSLVEKEAPESFDINQTIAMSTEDLGTAARSGSGASGAEEAKPAFVASVTRDVFHRTGCAWIKATPDDHKVWFSTAQEAWDSGRRACKTCDPAAAEPADTGRSAGPASKVPASRVPASKAPASKALGESTAGPSSSPAAPRPSSATSSGASAKPASGTSRPAAPGSGTAGGSRPTPARAEASKPTPATPEPATRASEESAAAAVARKPGDDPDATRPPTSSKAEAGPLGAQESNGTPGPGSGSAKDSETVLVDRASLTSSAASSDSSDDDVSSGSETKSDF